MKIKDILDQGEIRYFTAKSDLQAWFMLVCDWVAIFAIMALVYTWTNPLTVLLAIFLLGGRALGLAVIMHDCGHKTFFQSDRLNQFVGQWLCAAPAFNDLHDFATAHLQHHKKAGTDQDPDLPNYQEYPVSKASFKRKVWRDLSGQTGVKLLSYVFLSAFSVLDPAKRAAAMPFLKMLLAQLVFIAVLAVVMSPWLYLLWLAAILSTYMLAARVRQVAEHAGVPDLFDLDPRKHARTTIPSWWERVFIAPNFVNYHLEHHFMASVPCYKLRELHQLIKGRQLYSDTYIYRGYGDVLAHAVL